MIYTLVYILLTALSFVLIHQLGENLPLVPMVLLTTSYAIIFFHLINYKTILQAYRKAFVIKQAYAILLFSVVVMWGGSFLIPIYFSPAILGFCFVIYPCICGAFFAYRNSRQATSLFVCCAAFMILILFYVTLFPHYTFRSFLLMLISTMGTGLFSYLYFWQSHQFNHYRFKSTEILAIRFWLLFCIPLVLLFKQHTYQLINAHLLWQTLILSCFTLIFPIYCSQKSIEKIGANLHSVLIGITPFATFALEKVVMKTKTNAIGYLSIVLALVIFVPWVKAAISRR